MSLEFTQFLCSLLVSEASQDLKAPRSRRFWHPFDVVGGDLQGDHVCLPPGAAVFVAIRAGSGPIHVGVLAG